MSRHTTSEDSRSLTIVALLTGLSFGCNGPGAAAAPGAALEPLPSPHAPAEPTQAELIQRGEELVRLGACRDCHTPMKFDEELGMPVPDFTRHLSGHPAGAPEPTNQPGPGDQAVIGPTFTSFRLPFGTVYSANLTPDKETGLGTWQVGDFIATMRTGHKKGSGRTLLPPMPWENLQPADAADLAAMFAYLQSVPPISNKVPAPQVPADVIAHIDATNRRALETRSGAHASVKTAKTTTPAL
jgi:hypothetical protein